MFKVKMALLLSLIFVMLFFSGCSSKPEKNDEVIVLENGEEVVSLSDIVIRVDDVLVSKDLFEKYYELNIFWYGVDFGAEALELDFEGVPVREVIKSHVLDQLVEQSLVKRYVLANGFEVDEELLKEKLQEQKAVLQEDREMKRAYEEVGIDDEFMRYAVENSMIQAVFQSMVKEVIASDETRLNSLFDNYPVQVNARHILVDSESLANELKQRLEEKDEDGEAIETFEDLAKSYSNDIGTADRGGNLGFFARGIMVTEFEMMAFSLPVGVVSEPIQTQLGYHLIEVLEKKTVSQMIAAEEDEVLINRYKDEVIGSVFHEYAHKILTETRNNALVEIFYENLDSDKE